MTTWISRILTIRHGLPFCGRQIRSKRRRLERRLRLEPLDARMLLAGDFLYVSDGATDSVQKFDANTGAFVGSLVAGGSAGLHGPRGIALDHGNLLVVNQNVGLPKNGEVLRFNGKTGAAAVALVPSSDANAPFSPAGIVVRDNVAYVADTRDDSASGRIAKYDATTGAFLGDLVPIGFAGEFRPRGLVFGPDGGLYVSVFSETQFNSADPPGYILRFDPATGAHRIVAKNDGDRRTQTGEAPSLHNPEGLVFAPDGTIYVTSNRVNVTTSVDENTHVVKINPQSGNQVSDIELDPHAKADNPARLFAQSIVFGPNGKLYIPITATSLNDGTSTGGVLTLDPASQQTANFVPTSAALGFPYYLTFGQTNPATLAYQPWHNFITPLDVDDDGYVVPKDALIVINEVNGPTVTDASGRLPNSRGVSKYYFDVDGDGFTVPLDALIVINHVEDQQANQPEGEASGVIIMAFPTGSDSLSTRSDGIIPVSLVNATLSGQGADVTTDSNADRPRRGPPDHSLLSLMGTIRETLATPSYFDLHPTKRDLADCLLEGADLSGKLPDDEPFKLIRE